MIRSFLFIYVASLLAAAPVHAADSLVGAQGERLGKKIAMPVAAADSKPAGKIDVKSEKQEEEEKDKKKTVVKSVDGKVSSVFGNKISLETSRSEEDGIEEIMIPISKDVELEKIASAKDLAFGDAVKIEYEIVFRESEPDKILSTTAKKITLVSKAKKQSAPMPVDGPDDGALTAGEEPPDEE